MKKLWIHIFQILLFVWITPAPCDSATKIRIGRSYRLPKSIIPLHYTLTMEPLLESGYDPPTFVGNIIIEMTILTSTERIVLHSKDLHIPQDTVTIVNSNGGPVPIQNTTVDEEREFYIIHVNNKLEKNETYTLTIKHFSGILNPEKMGFYLAKYTNSEGQERKLAMTQFEANYARYAFPCFDEPALKAKFIIHIIRSKQYTSVSNQELATIRDLGDGRFQDTYKETVPMSTYVVAFVVSNYKHTKQIDRIRVFEKPEAVDDGKADYIALEASKLLKALENYIGINYTFSKMDLLGVPDEYFLPGAMENWGLVIFGESHLLYSNTTSTSVDLQRCTTYTGHELAHQWFGNLVTPIWWNYMWLSEGFAAYFQYHISDIVEPSWRLAEQYVTDHFQLALRNDDSAHTPSMNSEPRYAGSLPSAWIAYYKACAVITMTQHFLSRPIFKKGLNIYLQDNKFRATKAADLYSAFQKAVDEAGANKLLGNLTVPNILSTWDTNRGYPVVTATRNYETGAVTLSQKVFRIDGSTHNSNVWYIPISYFHQLNDNKSFSETTANLWFTEETITIDNNFTVDGWFLLNKLQTSYYRANYDITNWQRIVSFLVSKEFKSIPPVNRAQLIDDAFNLAESKQISYEIPLNLSEYLIQETDLIPINSFLKSVEHLTSALSATNEYDIFQNYVTNLLSEALNYLGFHEKSDDKHTDKLNRMNILKWLCRFGNSECKNLGLQMLRQWKETGTNSVSPDLEESLFCGAIQIATQEEWNFLYQKYYSTKDISQKSRYMKSLGCSNNNDILKNMFITVCNENNTIETSDRAAPIKSLLEINPKSVSAALNYIGVYCTKLDATFKDIVGPSIGDFITTQEQLEQAKELNGYDAIQWYGGDNLKLLQKNNVSVVSNWLLDYSKRNIECHNIVNRTVHQ